MQNLASCFKVGLCYHQTYCRNDKWTQSRIWKSEVTTSTRSATQVAVNPPFTDIVFYRPIRSKYDLTIDCYKIVDGHQVGIGYDIPDEYKTTTGFRIVISETAIIDYSAFPIL